MDPSISLEDEKVTDPQNVRSYILLFTRKGGSPFRMDPPSDHQLEEYIRIALLEQRKGRGLSPVDRLQRRLERITRFAVVRIALEQLLQADNYFIMIRHCEEHGRSRNLEMIMDIIANFANDEITVLVYSSVASTSMTGFITFVFCNDLNEILHDWDMSLEKHISRALEICGYQID